MKAYIGWDDEEDENLYQIIFANTAREAKKRLSHDDICCDSKWIALRVKRCPEMDGKEVLLKRELDKDLWRILGWGFYDEVTPDPSETTDEEFYEWYDKTFGMPL